MASDIWLRTILIVRKETRCRQIGYSCRLTARVFYMHHPTDRITQTTAFVTPVVDHWLEREIAQWKRTKQKQKQKQKKQKKPKTNPTSPPPPKKKKINKKIRDRFL